ncbi:MAG: UDP-N-acetylmuramate:L-alanyl-gamma-D-glutamyl-meso-diaminopimelate ligase [Verrucomicrobiales bacterium]
MLATGQHYHFIGICGTAMGAVAAAMKERGFVITGSDAGVYEPMASFLRAKGIAILEGFRPENIPATADVIVIGNAISRGNPECEEVLNRRLLYTSLPELLKHQFLRGRRNYVVTGTHGKTTTTSLLAWLFESAGRNPSFMIGGLTRNFGQGGRFTEGEFTVLEGDEYDTAFFDKRSKFIHYLPECVIINNLEYDHADIFPDLESIQLSFNRMLRLVPRNGLVLVNGDDAQALAATRENRAALMTACPAPLRTVGLGEGCDHRIEAIDFAETGMTFRLDGEPFAVPMDGEINVRNASMAIAAAQFGGLSIAEIRAGLASFLGVARRQSVRGTTAAGVSVIDDFGHHPTAIRETAEALRRRHVKPGARLWALFEPRSNTTKRRVFQHELAAALAAADGVILSEVFEPHKVPEGDRLDVDRLVEDIRTTYGRSCFVEPTTDAIVARLAPLVRRDDVVVVFSNGGFGGIHEKLLAMPAPSA